jgi:protoheme IX farnesyltransferase
MSALLVPYHVAGGAYLVAASLLGALFLGLGAYGLRPGTGVRWARSLFGYSIVYLVLLLSTMLVDRVRI